MSTATLPTPDATQAGLMDALLRNPADDAPRLLLADWLDIDGPPECRDPARAEFIRVQCELARLPDCGHEFPAADCPECRRNPPSPAMRVRAAALRGRERALIQANGLAWVRSLPGGPWAVDGRGDGFANRCAFARGFVARVECPLAAFLGGPCGRCEGSGRVCQRCLDADSPSYDSHGSDPCPDCSGSGHTPGIAAALFAAQPVTEVRLTDREPWHSHKGSYHWYDTARPYSGVHQESDLPTELWELLDEALFVNNKWQERMKVYPTADAARAALSAAAVRYGRTLAGIE
jgi:uncharacterized protein (TIGR02996 family)